MLINYLEPYAMINYQGSQDVHSGSVNKIVTIYNIYCWLLT